MSSDYTNGYIMAEDYYKPRVRELEASERELQATVTVLSEALDNFRDATARYGIAVSKPAKQQTAKHRTWAAEIFPALKTVDALLADLPAAAREHLARDAEREQALVAYRDGTDSRAIMRPPLELPDA